MTPTVGSRPASAGSAARTPLPRHGGRCANGHPHPRRRRRCHCVPRRWGRPTPPPPRRAPTGASRKTRRRRRCTRSRRTRRTARRAPRSACRDARDRVSTRRRRWRRRRSRRRRRRRDSPTYGRQWGKCHRRTRRTWRSRSGGPRWGAGLGWRRRRRRHRRYASQLPPPHRVGALPPLPPLPPRASGRRRASGARPTRPGNHNDRVSASTRDQWMRSLRGTLSRQTPCVGRAPTAAPTPPTDVRHQAPTAAPPPPPPPPLTPAAVPAPRTAARP